MSAQIKCPMCGREFGRAQAASACAGCSLGRDCGMLRCPNCGYEMVGETRLGAMLRKLREAMSGAKRQG
ncbi:MAG TPA: hypothetical protein VM221_13950 [Armatimonadota bacterium]|nr:hypothetical protein [Armatimonadota bacterium]